MAEAGLSHVSYPLLLLLFAGYSIAEAPSTLRLSHVIYRHGDRSPTRTFPTDKHQENSWPQGFGQLTQMGMMQEYQLGKFFRNMYNGFLNETYIRQEIYVRSTDKDRTLMSAYTNLAGLYPPNGSQVWNESIHWQPIPVHTVPYKTDNLLRAGTPCQRYNPMMYAAFGSQEVKQYELDNKLLLMDAHCPKMEALRKRAYKSFDVFRYEAMNKLLRVGTPCKYGEELLLEVYSSSEVIEYENQNSDFLNKVRTNAGMPNATLYEIMDTVPGPLYCEKMHNLSMPDWVTDDDYERLGELKAFQIKLWFYTPEMQRIRGGVLLSEIVNHTKSKVSGDLDPRMKIYMYSAHDTTLAVLLIALNTWDGKIPPYASALIFELHRRSEGSYFVRLLYKNDSLSNPETEAVPLSIRGCDLDCDLDKFLELVKPMLYVGDWFKECANESTPVTHFSSTPIIVAVAVIIIIVLLLAIIVIFYRKKTGIIAYQSANFSAETASE